MKSRILLLAGLLLVVAGSVNCETIFMGGYTAFCDEPATLYSGDMGEPETIRKAQCQVDKNICCRRKDAAGAMSRDHRTFCLNTWECYLVEADGDCLGDIDCNQGLRCEGGVAKSGVFGRCQCPNEGLRCPGEKNGLPYCCAKGSVCGMGQCQEPEPPDMSPPEDLRAEVEDLTAPKPADLTAPTGWDLTRTDIRW